MEEKPFHVKCKEYLQQRWQNILLQNETGSVGDVVSDEEIKESIRECLTSKSKSYHYVIPTQLLAKAVNPKLDCRSLQASYDTPGAFDARTIAHKVIVPFDRENSNVLGGSSEPYVNNPLRVYSVTKENRSQQKDKLGWDKLVSILEEVETADDPDTAKKYFQQTLIEILHLLKDATVVYPTPNRISLYRTLQITEKFIQGKSGGDRVEAVTTALFQTIASHFSLFDEIKREKVNAADASSGMAGDIECVRNGKVALLVEVKDKELTITQVESTLLAARAKQIGEILFLAQQGINSGDEKPMEKMIDQEFSSGQNIYTIRFTEFACAVLVLFGEQGRVEFIRRVGPELDRSGSNISHRKAWANLLRNA